MISLIRRTLGLSIAERTSSVGESKKRSGDEWPERRMFSIDSKKKERDELALANMWNQVIEVNEADEIATAKQSTRPMSSYKHSCSRANFDLVSDLSSEGQMTEDLMADFAMGIDR